ncbi:hypothetical protein SAMN06265349_1011222 [Flavobacterium resistens]|uniref:TonB-dependent outer membrane receptor, SusC/RagA subfamily, signature region n=1 Tax=Flavobacterium resistens TaxID=443612 RepID=A0A521BMH5_9FLAO|nr:hypothetical protein [Flavobacterium resistens]MRX67531.1 hypothetical protein [Flavobacterium resistens]SMO48338.1 hypothetical protein SAMN06265349_1011222 [Flavobacterium resistens]
MIKFITTALLFATISAFSQSRYELSDKGKDKFYLSDSISNLAKTGKITVQPIVVVDGIPHRFQDLEKEKLVLSKMEISKIIAMDKQKGISIYGTYGEAGVLIVTTNRSSFQKRVPEVKEMKEN